MKMFLLFLFLDSNTGNIVGAIPVGPVENIAVCHDQAKALFEGAVKKKLLPDNTTAVPLCLDVSKVPLGHPPEAANTPPSTKMGL